jgi:hypothetical protein
MSFTGASPLQRLSALHPLVLDGTVALSLWASTACTAFSDTL